MNTNSKINQLAMISMALLASSACAVEDQMEEAPGLGLVDSNEVFMDSRQEHVEDLAWRYLMLEEDDDLSILAEIDGLSPDEIDHFVDEVEQLLQSEPDLSLPQFPMDSLKPDDGFHRLNFEVDESRSDWSNSLIPELEITTGPLAASLPACTDPGTMYHESSSRTYSINYSYYSPYCYGYKQFPNDDENDCFIRFNMSGGKAHYYYRTVNFWANKAANYYEEKGTVVAAYRDGAGRGYLRMDGSWCSLFGAEDGFLLR